MVSVSVSEMLSVLSRNVIHELRYAVVRRECRAVLSVAGDEITRHAVLTRTNCLGKSMLVLLTGKWGFISGAHKIIFRAKHVYWLDTYNRGIYTSEVCSSESCS
jgi:hypothetical protein